MKKELSFAKIERWDEALPLGNGRLGGLVYGTENPIISLDKGDLWDLTPAPELAEAGFNYPNMIKLVDEGTPESFKETCRLFDECYNHKTPTKIKAGRLYVDMDLREESQFQLDYQNGIATVSSSNNSFLLFFSMAEEIGVLHLQHKVKVRFEPSPILFDAKKGLGYPAPTNYLDGPFEVFEVRNARGLAFVFLGLWNGSDYFFDIVSSLEGETGLTKAKERLMKASKKGLDQLKEEQRKWWSAYWGESSVNIPEEAFQKEYDLANYLLASCSKAPNPPMPLQGLWTSDDGQLPPWKGDYHNDLNTQMSYASALKSNHPAEFLPLIDYLWAHKKDYEKVASSFYKVPGLMVPGVSDFEGGVLGGWPMYSLSPTMSIWSVKCFDDYYRYCPDARFLKERVYPMLFETAEAIMGLLVHKDGRYYLPLSSSPEIHDNTLSSYLKPISNFDVSLLHYLFSTLVSYCGLLGLDPKPYQEILSNLPPLAHGDDGSLLLAPNEPYKESHRHFSHLLPIYPLKDINLGKPEDEKTMEASLQVLEKYGTAYWVGFSFVWEAALAARADQTGLAYRRLSEFLDGFLSPNGFHLNGDYKNKGYSDLKYRPFTLEAIYGYCDALTEMLIQNRDGLIVIFPNIPKEWKEVSFHNLRSEGGLLWSAASKNGSLAKLSVYSPRQTTLKLQVTVNGMKQNIPLFVKAGMNIMPISAD